MNVSRTISLVALRVTCLRRDRQRFFARKTPCQTSSADPRMAHKNHDLSPSVVGKPVFNISQHRSPCVSGAIRPVTNCHVAICPVFAEFSQRADVLGETPPGELSSPHGSPGARQGLSAQHRSQAARRGSADASCARRARSRRRSGLAERVRSARPGHGLPSARVARLRSHLAAVADGRARARRKFPLPALWVVQAVPQRWHVPSVPTTAGGAPC